ncbi:MAG: cupin-like domain-containing protein [Asticcacaulis sp.]
MSQTVRIIIDTDPAHIPYDQLMADQTPVIFRGLAKHWPLVQAGLTSALCACDYLKRFYQGRPVTAFTGAPEIEGRFFYNADLTGLNFQAGRTLLTDFLDQLLSHVDNLSPPSLYLGSTDLGQYLPGLREDNDLNLDHPMFRANPPLASIWIGNRTTATAHYDMSHNLAVCVAGRRRFILFPPSQVSNLYPGPLEPTPGGQVVSMVDFRNPDFDLYPRFAEALMHAHVTDLEAGDVLFYPALWWHHVEALEPFNILINYWWNTTPAFMDTPMNTLLHGLLSLRDRPDAEKTAWRALFDYYLFGPSETPRAHLPEAAQGALGTLNELTARRLRAQLLNRFNR